MLAKCIDLLGDAHRADFGRDGAADAAGEHRSGQHRAELAAHRKIDQRTQPGFEAELPELGVRLHCQHHADERARERDHRQAEHANVVETARISVSRRGSRVISHETVLPREERHVAERLDPANRDGAEIGNPIGERNDRSAAEADVGSRHLDGAVDMGRLLICAPAGGALMIERS